MYAILEATTRKWGKLILDNKWRLENRTVYILQPDKVVTKSFRERLKKHKNFLHGKVGESV